MLVLPSYFMATTYRDHRLHIQTTAQQNYHFAVKPLHVTKLNCWQKLFWQKISLF